ncbi:MAG: Zn-dependent exopeptidase M28 [Candidatus Latescibacteria bacterium]|nr:Zn-dependent exopeptidase M28 [Candidatus Latescibacterota bacterium]
MGIIPDYLTRIDPGHLSQALFHLSQDPLPYRKLNHTRPGQSQNTLYEADDYLQERLETWGYVVKKEGVQVQAFRCDASKPKVQQYSPPAPEDPWYTACNLYVKKQGTVRPDEIVLLLAHKDSQSWVDSPGAYDNGAGTVALLEIARVLKDYEPGRSLWFLFCNEEHRPWTSVAAAQNAKARGDDLVAIFNLDSMGGKSQQDIDAGLKTNAAIYTTPEGERLADLVAEVNDAYRIGLVQRKARRARPGDDDGSFINAGYPSAIATFGSFPYADPAYHTEDDRPERVDIPNLAMAAQASLAAALRVDLSER